MSAHTDHFIVMLTTIDYSCRISVTFEPSSVELTEVLVRFRGHFMCPISARGCVSRTFPNKYAGAIGLLRSLFYFSAINYEFLQILVKYIMLLRDVCVCCS